MTTYVVKLTTTAYGLPVTKQYEVEAETPQRAAAAARAKAQAAGQTALAFYGEAVTSVKEET